MTSIGQKCCAAPGHTLWRRIHGRHSQLVTNQPDPQAFHVSGEAIVSETTDGGGFNYTINGMLNLPLVDNQMALRLVGTDSRTSGWINRIVLSDFPLPDPPDLSVATYWALRSQRITSNRTKSIWQEPALRCCGRSRTT